MKPNKEKEKEFDSENQDGKEGGFKDRRNGKGNRGKRERDYDEGKRFEKGLYTEQYALTENQVSATNVIEHVPFLTAEGGRNLDLIILSVLHNGFVPSALWNHSQSNHSDVIRAVIKKRASLYYSVLAPTTISDIQTKLGDIATNSLMIFAMICWLWKTQNCAQVEDEDGYNFARALYCNYDLTRKIGIYGVDADGPDNKGFPGLWGISNAAWKKEILSNLRRIYLSKNAADLIYTLVGHYIQFDYADESNIRLWDMIPENAAGKLIHTLGETALSYNDFKTELDGLAAIVDASFNAYPFMEEILADLKMFNPGESYNFERDLAQMRVNVMMDRDHAFENMCYMCDTQQGISRNGTVDPSTIYSRIVVSEKLKGVQFTYYKDAAAANSLIYFNRCIADTRSMTNALRSAIYPLCITYFWKESGSGLKAVNAMHERTIHVIGTTGYTLYNMQVITSMNNQLGLIDMPNDAAVTFLNDNAIGSTDGYGGVDLSSQGHEANLQAGDYILAEGDVESVVSDACAYLLFCNPELPTVAQTLGNSGK